jgi:hypothetical protein
MAATTTLLGLVTPTQGTLSGTWGDTVNYGITDYLDIAIAGTLSFAGDGAITLANTTGSSSGNAITSTTAQYMVIRITGTLTTPKIITAPSYSKLYMVDNAATGSTVSFIRSGQTPAVSVAVGEKCFVYYNGTDYVKIASSTAGTGSVTSVAATVPSIFSIAGSPITTSGTLAMTYSGTPLPAANGGTGIANNAAMTVTGSGNFAYTRTLTGTTNVTFPTTGTLSTLAGTETLTNKTIEAGTFTNGYTEEVATANTSTAYTIDLAGGSVQLLTLTGNCVYTFPTPVAGKSFILVQKQDATGSRTVTWPASVDWPSATAPTLTATASKADKFVFTAIDGTNWLGSVAGQNYTV